MERSNNLENSDVALAATAAWFSQVRYDTSGSLARSFSESDFTDISAALSRIGKVSWSRNPRMYSVLRIIGQEQLMDSFANEGVTDIAFPFTTKSLPFIIREPSIRNLFLEAQQVVLTKALDIEQDTGRHRHFLDRNDIPFYRIGEIGRGAYGHVRSTITHKEYARKLILRKSRTFGNDKDILRRFESEMNVLKRLRHRHIITFIGSYTDSKYVCLVISPVADCNLKEFLSNTSFSRGVLSIVRTYFGCLGAGLSYLHDISIRHKDIKPENILVKSNHVLLADFGQSLDWSESQHSTTSGFTLKTPKYCAPEVAIYCKRKSSSDIWSLGCVFLEMWTVLLGNSLQSLDEYFRTHGTMSPCYYINMEACESWVITCLAKKSDYLEQEALIPLGWIQNLMHKTPDSRWTARMLLNQITTVHEDPENTISYLGSCCIAEDESVCSVDSRETTLVSTSAICSLSSQPVHTNEHLTAPPSADLMQRVETLPADLCAEPPHFLTSPEDDTSDILPPSMLLAINNRFSKSQIPVPRRRRAKTRAELMCLPIFMKEEGMFPAVIYGLLKEVADNSSGITNQRKRQPVSPTLKSVAFKMTPAILHGYARYSVQDPTRNKETIIVADSSSKAHGMMILGLTAPERQAVYDYQSDEEILSSASAEITVEGGEKMLVEVGCYLWNENSDCLVRRDKELSFKEIQGWRWYREWMNKEEEEEERALSEAIRGKAGTQG